MTLHPGITDRAWRHYEFARLYRDNCRLCGSRDLECVRWGRRPSDDYVLLTPDEKHHFPARLVPVPRLRHIQLLDVVDPNILFGNYIYVTSISTSLVEHFREYTDEC